MKGSYLRCDSFGRNIVNWQVWDARASVGIVLEGFFMSIVCFHLYYISSNFLIHLFLRKIFLKR